MNTYFGGYFSDYTGTRSAIASRLTDGVLTGGAFGCRIGANSPREDSFYELWWEEGHVGDEHGEAESFHPQE